MSKNFNNKKKVLMVQGLHEEGKKLLLEREMYNLPPFSNHIIYRSRIANKRLQEFAKQWKTKYEMQKQKEQCCCILL